jgi:hypothetical protein
MGFLAQPKHSFAITGALYPIFEVLKRGSLRSAYFGLRSARGGRIAIR